jgi:hypothetical protein
VTERYTVNDVRGAFATFVELADSVGFDTRGWELEVGNSTYHRAYRHTRHIPGAIGPETTEFRPELGGNAREAWQTLSARVDTLRAIRDLRGETAAGVELPPAPTSQRRGPRL